MISVLREAESVVGGRNAHRAVPPTGTAFPASKRPCARKQSQRRLPPPPSGRPQSIRATHSAVHGAADAPVQRPDVAHTFIQRHRSRFFTDSLAGHSLLRSPKRQSGSEVRLRASSIVI